MKKILLIALFVFGLISPLKVQAASASFSTSGGGSVYPSTNINVTVSAYGSDPYNAVDVTVNFANLTYVGVSATGGWTGVAGPTRSGNTITYSGALLGSSVTGSKAVLNLSFRAPASIGSATISASGQIALADGYGTVVSGGGNTVTYNIIAAPPPPKPAPGVPTVTSTSHPNQEAWSKVKEVNLSWNKEDGVNVFSHALDQVGDTNPDDEAEGSDTTFLRNDLDDGIYYFHVKAHNDVGWGPAAHYKINIDTTNPDPFKIAYLEDPDDSTKYILYFATNDVTSGVVNFNLKVDGQDLEFQASGYKVSKNISKVLVTAYDNAGNSTSDELILKDTTLTPIDGEVKENQSFSFDWKTAAVTLSLVVLSGVIITLCYFVYKRSKKNIKQSINS